MNLYGYVYLFKAHDQHEGLYKIGKSNYPKRRLKRFSKMPFRAELLHTIECSDPFLVEARLHEIFSEQRTQGEWFQLTDEDVNLILSYKDQSDVLPDNPNRTKMAKTVIDWIKIEHYMKQAGIEPVTKSELAMRAELSELTVSNVTRGKVGWSGKTLDKIANALGLDDPTNLLTTYNLEK